MLVAIQVARSGNTSPNGGSQPDSQTVASTITRAGMKLSLEVCVCFFVCVWRRGELMVSTLATGRSSSDLSHFPGHYVVSLGKKTLCSHSASLHPGVLMGTGEVNAGGNSAMDIENYLLYTTLNEKKNPGNTLFACNEQKTLTR